MEDNDAKPEKRYPLSAAKMSKTPSWIMLGFLLGAAFVVALPPLRKKPPPEPAAFRAAEPARLEGPRERPLLTVIEAVFEEWGQHAVWSGDLTEVALWNIRDQAYNEFYQVRRVGDAYYFRSITRLTRRIIKHGRPLPESPLQFTESEEQYAEWHRYGRAERAPDPLPASAPPPASARPSLLPAPVDRSLPLFTPAIPPPTGEKILLRPVTPPPQGSPTK